LLPKHRVLPPEIIYELETAARLAQEAMHAPDLPQTLGIIHSEPPPGE
jgi:hypothetical protein